MNRLRTLGRNVVVRVLLFWMLLFSCCGRYWARDEKTVPVPRNIAWNQMKFHLGKATEDLFIVQPFMRDHEQEVKVSAYDLPTLKALDDAEQELRAAEKAIHQVREELSYREQASNAFRK